MSQFANSMKRSFGENFDDSLDQQKRSKPQSALPHEHSLDSATDSMMPESKSEYSSLLHGPGPLGLKLHISPSFLDLIQTKLSEKAPKKSTGGAISSAGMQKPKASNFSASVLRIGTWQYNSQYQGDLVAKFYFAKHKLVWEILDGGLKYKIEFPWSDIMGIKAYFPDGGLDTMEVVLVKEPVFFKEINPQPRKHTLWQASCDFTDGQASLHRRHILQSPEGSLGKHFQKLIRCDPRLRYLSQLPGIVLESPYFEMGIPSSDDPKASSHAHRSSPSGTQTSTRNEAGNDGQASKYLGLGSTSGSAVENYPIEEISSGVAGETELLNSWEHMRLPEPHQSMSVNDLVSPTGHNITDENMPVNPALSGLGEMPDLEDIGPFFSGNSAFMSSSKEPVFMSNDTSFGYILQQEPETIQNIHSKDSWGSDFFWDGKLSEENFTSASASHMTGFAPASGSESAENAGLNKQTDQGKSREDSEDSEVELLENLPRIASLPKLLD